MMTISTPTTPALQISHRWLSFVRWPSLPAFSSRDFRYLRMLSEDYKRAVAPAPLQPDPARWAADRITASWLGHSTVLINFFGLNILTDPALLPRVGLGIWPLIIGPKRYVAPALTVSQLPAIDLILLSHAHMDHFDLGTLRRFKKGPSVVTAHATSDLLKRTRLHDRVTELAWGEKARLTFDRLAQARDNSVEVEAFEVNHWGARLRTDDYRGYNGYIVRRAGAAILFAGDTANTALLRKVRGKGAPSRGGIYDLALMPIGAYNPWINSHCTPEQAVSMADDAGGRFILPIHHQTFRLSNEPRDEPIQRLTNALFAAPERLALRRIGETFEVPEVRPGNV